MGDMISLKLFAVFFSRRIKKKQEKTKMEDI